MARLHDLHGPPPNLHGPASGGSLCKLSERRCLVGDLHGDLSTSPTSTSRHICERQGPRADRLRADLPRADHRRADLHGDLHETSTELTRQSQQHPARPPPSARRRWRRRHLGAPPRAARIGLIELNFCELISRKRRVHRRSTAATRRLCSGQRTECSRPQQTLIERASKGSPRWPRSYTQTLPGTTSAGLMLFCRTMSSATS